MVGPRAPQKVKDAWMEAAKEVYANGAGIQKNGMMSHISQMMVQRCNKMLRGEADYSNILGSTVGSAIRATKQALYDLDHPLGSGYRSIEVQQARMKEREFYVAFLEKLDATEVDSNEVQKKTSAVLDRIGSQAPDEVKNAWMEAEKETGAFFTVYGMYISADGKHAHMTQMGIDRFVRWYRGEINPDDLLGSSVESAIKAVNKWIYDLEHPLA